MTKKSDGVKDVVDWLEKRCKDLNKELEETKKDRTVWCGSYVEDYETGALAEAVAIKVSIEKYYKKLKHEGM